MLLLSHVYATVASEIGTPVHVFAAFVFPRVTPDTHFFLGWLKPRCGPSVKKKNSDGVQNRTRDLLIDRRARATETN